MIFGSDRDQLRGLYLETWRKMQEGEALEPLERQIAAVIEQHPEYHRILADREVALAREYLPEMGETNPFLHMGLHIAIQEQLSTGRPHGIVECFHRLKLRLGDAHAAEHEMIECLAESLWEAQRDGVAPDEQRYLERLQERARQ
ncbi:MAG: DUF1841 family protein [Gammaproteobacteria bacterium]